MLEMRSSSMMPSMASVGSASLILPPLKAPIDLPAFYYPFRAVQEHSQRGAVPRPDNVVPDTVRQRTVHSEVTSGAIGLYVEI